MIGVFGALLLFGVALCLCRIIRETEHRRLSVTEDALSLLGQMRTMIALYRTPREEIYRRLELPAEGKGHFLARLREAGSLEEALREEHAFPPEVKELLLRFASEMGQGHTAEELSLLDAYIAKLAPITDQMREQMPHRIKLHCTLVVTGVLMLLVLIL